jgi:hypothetical protein
MTIETKQVKLRIDVYDRLTALGIKDTYSNIVKFLLEVYDNVEVKKQKRLKK